MSKAEDAMQDAATEISEVQHRLLAELIRITMGFDGRLTKLEGLLEKIDTNRLTKLEDLVEKIHTLVQRSS